jgi:hypothetical protein
MNEPRQWYDYEHTVTGRIYTIRYYYEEGDKKITCTVSLKPIDAQTKEELITSFVYDPERHTYDLQETATIVAINHGDMNPRDELDLD